MSYGMNPGAQLRGPTGQGQGGNTAGSFKEKRPHGYEKYAINKFPPELMQLFQQWMEMTRPEGQLSQLARGEPGAFEQLEAPAMRQFQELTGGLASRFSGAGMGARRGSGFQNAASQATQDFASQLQAQRLGLTRQAQQDLASMYNQILGNNPYEMGYAPKKERQPSGWGGIAGGVGGGIVGLAASGGNPYVGLQGAQTGYNLFQGL